MDFPDRHPNSPEGCSELTGHFAASVAQLSLSGHVVEFEGIDILLAFIGSDVPDDDHMTASF